MVDQAVLVAQKWVNDPYPGRAGDSRVDEKWKNRLANYARINKSFAARVRNYSDF